MKLRPLSTTIVLFILLFIAQDMVHAENQIVRECLVLSLPRDRRMSLMTKDPVEEMLVKGTWKAPREGQELSGNVWKKALSDENGWFHGRDFRGAYAYVSVTSDRDRLVILDGRAHNRVYVNGQPRAGNRYQAKDEFESWEPRFNFSRIPVRLRKGKNDLLFRCFRGRLKVIIHDTDAAFQFNTNDVTVPDLLIGENIDQPGAVVVINGSRKVLRGARITSTSPLIRETEIPIIQPMTIRKVPFMIKGQAPREKGQITIPLKLTLDGRELAAAEVQLRVVGDRETHKRTFFSSIDNSVQYFAVNPASQDSDQPKALVLSVHGANVEALNQAGSYYPKTWAHIVSPTNRRPYGFDWEDWGRSDAMEVLNLAKQQFNIDPNRVYLSGHSMGGHGTWHLGAMFPDQFAAIGPSAGWISFWSYRVRDEQTEETPLEKLLWRSMNASNTFEFIDNYKQQGVYIIHGSADNNVPVEQAKMMVEHLQGRHHDFYFHEQDSAGHWWDVSDEPGADCVDWPDLFDFFARHAVPGKERVRHINFTTASPGVSATDNWITINAQQKPFAFSKIDIQVFPGSRKYVGSTENIQRLVIDLISLSNGLPFSVVLDEQDIVNINWPLSGKLLLEKSNGKWQVASAWPASDKNPQRYGAFKEAINHNVVFVYGTAGSREENEWSRNKARYDAEVFWYQGNGSIDVIADTEFSPASFADRNVILYGNAGTNRAWKELLPDCPVWVEPGKVRIGDKIIRGNDLGGLFIYPRRDSAIASVGVVAGTGIEGMRLTDVRPYLYPGYAYPDMIIFSTSMLRDGLSGIKAAGFFGTDWQIDSGDFLFNQ